MSDAKRVRSSAFEVRLILEVQSRPGLYDPRHEKYKDSLYRNRIWGEIGNVLRARGYLCSKRWRTLRDRYVKEKRRMAMNTQKDEGLWMFFHLMSFLDPYLTLRKPLAARSVPEYARRNLLPRRATRTIQPVIIPSDSESTPTPTPAVKDEKKPIIKEQKESAGEPEAVGSNQPDDATSILPCSYRQAMAMKFNQKATPETNAPDAVMETVIRDVEPQSDAASAVSDECADSSSANSSTTTIAKEISSGDFRSAKRMRMTDSNATSQQQQNDESSAENLFKYLGSIVKTWPKEIQQRELLNFHKLVIDRDSQIRDSEAS